MSATKSVRSVLMFGALVVPALAGGAGISGTVVNKTTGKPSARDEVVLVDVSADMREAGRTKSNTSGHFQFHGLPGGVPHLVRVIHGGVRYESAISATDEPLDVTVFDSSRAIGNLKTNVQAMRFETVGDNLRVTEMLTLVNSSNPPRTIQKQRLFWLTLPRSATVLSSAARGPEADTLEHVATAAPDEDRCYFNFPLRPGTTKIQLQYQIPYSEVMIFVLHVPFPADTLGVVVPSAIAFASAQLAGYTKDSDQHGDIAEVMHDVAAGDAPPFTISAATGSAMSAKGAQADPLADALRMADAFGGKKAESTLASSRNRSSGPTLFWAVALPFLVALLVAIYLYRRRPSRQNAATKHNAAQTGEGIKEELFNLESARIQNRISKARYTKAKAVLERQLATVSDHENVQCP